MKALEVKTAFSMQQGALEEVSSKLAQHGTKLISITGSAGSGKTTFIQAVLEHCPDPSAIAVITADPCSNIDGERIARHGAQVVQLVAPEASVLDGGMLVSALNELDLTGIAWLFVENLGTLIFPNDYFLEEQLSILVFSVAEGTDKPAKYPNAFKAADIIFINKIDLIPFTDFDLKHCTKHITAINPSALLLNGSTKRLSTMESIWDHIKRKLETKGR